MITHLLKYNLRNLSSNFKKSSIMNQGKIYMRLIEIEEKIEISFLMPIKQNLRQFNLCRKPFETIENLSNRISANVQKIVCKKIKKKEGIEPPNLTVSFLNNKDIIPSNTECKDLFSMQGGVYMKLSDLYFEAVFNPPWIVSLQLPQSILEGFCVYPEHLVTQNTEVKHTIFNWYIGPDTLKNDDKKWELVQTGFTYTPTCRDINLKLKLECIPGNSIMQGPMIEVVSTNAVGAGPGKCPFETRHMFTQSRLSNDKFRCVSYNILADLYCDSDFTRSVLHPYCPAYALHIDYRKQLITKELLGYNADIICLQEVDKKIFEYCLKPILSNDEFEGQFYKKGKEVAEGLAVFYRSDRFSLISQESIVLAKAITSENCLKPIWNSLQGNTALLERLLDRGTVASCTVLQSTDNPDKVIIVGNTHLYFHPDADHIRLLQGGICIYWLRNILKQLKDKMPDKDITLMLSGDFNSVPSCGIYQLYTTGVAPSDLPDWKSNADEAVKNLTLEQDIPLASACGTPEFTNFTVGFADCLDYIYYDKTKLAVQQVVPFPSKEELEANTALPSVVFPSDHIALIADFKFLPV